MNIKDIVAEAIAPQGESIDTRAMRFDNLKVQRLANGDTVVTAEVRSTVIISLPEGFESLDLEDLEDMESVGADVQVRTSNDVLEQTIRAEALHVANYALGELGQPQIIPPRDRPGMGPVGKRRG